LAVAIEVAGGLRHGLGEVATEARVILFLAAARGGNDDPAGAREARQERGAGGAGVHERQRPADRLQPFREFRRRKVGAAEVEAGLAAIEGAVADQHEPQLGVAGGGLFREQPPELFPIRFGAVRRGRALADDPQFRPGAGAGVGPRLDLRGKVRRELRVTGRAADQEYGGRFGRAEGTCGEGEEEQQAANHGRPFQRRRPHSASRQARAKAKKKGECHAG
jgi:hypothetical protein